MIPLCIRIKPVSPWRTPWQADTLFGALCWTLARAEGGDALKRDVIEPALKDEPPFVLSDACPGDWLPIPAVLRARDWGDNRKAVKRARWLDRDTFQQVCNGTAPSTPAGFHPDPFAISQRTHNTLDRITGTTGDAEQGLAPFEKEEWHVHGSGTNGSGHLTLYARVTAEFAQRLLDLLGDLALVGFGADIGTGRGQFEVLDAVRAPWLDDVPDKANAVVALSTFQPGPADPTSGCWETFTKFGRIGPHAGVANDDTAKRPLIMFRPGACLITGESRRFLGRAIPSNELLSTAAREALQVSGIDVIHPAFALVAAARFVSPVS